MLFRFTEFSLINKIKKNVRQLPDIRVEDFIAFKLI